MARKLAATFACLLFLAIGTCYAVEPAYYGPMGNPEEPATRPFKWAWRGVKALAYHSVDNFAEGNNKFPILGTAQTFRGVRIGVVELDESLVRGMIHSVPPPAGDYKIKRSANTFIERDIFLRNASDFATATLATGPSLGAGVAIFAAQKVTDHAPLDPNWRDVRINAKAIQHERAQSREPELSGPEGVRQAQERYLGDRYVRHERPVVTGNLLKLAK